MAVMSDNTPDPQDVREPELLPGEALHAPITGDQTAPMAAWARPRVGGKNHPWARAGYLPAKVEATDENCALYFPDAVGIVPRPKIERGSVFVGPDGKSGIEVWAQYVKALSAVQIRVDAGDHITTLADAEGRSNRPGHTKCMACAAVDVSVGTDGRCSLGCP